MKTEKAIVVKNPETVISTSIQPKPTRNEVVAAMARMKHAELVAERNTAKAKKDSRRDTLREKIRKFAMKNIRRITPEVRLGYTFRGDSDVKDVEIRFPLDNLPPDLRSELLEYHAMELPRVPDIADIRKEVRAAMGDCVGVEARVDALIANPETNKALQAMLEHIGMAKSLTV